MDRQLAAPRLAHALTDLAGHFLSVDDRFCDLLCRDRADIIGRTIIDLTAEPDRPLNAEKLDMLREHGAPFVIRKNYLRGDGGMRPVENSVSLVTNGIGGDVLAATVKPLPEATDLHFAATVRIARILLDEQRTRLAWGPHFQGADGRLILSAFLLEAEGSAVWASELIELAGGDQRQNLLRVWELVRAGALVVDGPAISLEKTSVRISSEHAKLLERHLAIMLSE